MIKTATPSEIREKLLAEGITIASWARSNNFPYHTVVQVLNGRADGRYGASHKVAVALGIKQGK